MATDTQKSVVDVIKEKIFNDKKWATYLGQHSGLKMKISENVDQWAKNMQQQLIMTNPFRDAEKQIALVTQMSANEVRNNIMTIERNCQYLYPFRDCDFDFAYYKKKLFAATTETEKNAIVQALLNEMRQLVSVKKSLWMQKIVHKEALDFIKKILRKLANLQKFVNLMSSDSNSAINMQGNCGSRQYDGEQGNEEQLKKEKQLEQCWNLVPDEDYSDDGEEEEEFSGLGMGNHGYSRGIGREMLQKTGLNLLEEVSKLLRSYSSVQEFANMLGRRDSQENEKNIVMKEKIVTHNEYHPESAYKGQVCGVTQGNDISAVLPSELALLRNPITKKLFELKFAQKQLLSFKYVNLVPQTYTEKKRDAVNEAKKEEKGPIIICVDTSASMSGDPETIAKVLAFALTRIALEDGRKCFLILFSTKIECLNLGDLQKGKNPIANLIYFLQMSFYGGTDVEPPLKKALEMLDKEDYKLADVLLISDFEMDDLSKKMQKDILKEQKKNTRFFSLDVGYRGNEQVLAVMDQKWEYMRRTKKIKRVDNISIDSQL